MAHCHVALLVVPFDTLSGEKHWSWYRMTHFHVRGTSHGHGHGLKQPLFIGLSTGHMSYHDQRLSHGTKVESSTPSSDEVYLFSDLGKLCHFLRIQFLKDDIKFFFFLNQKTKMSIYTKRENAIGANRRYFYQVCFCVD
jgi:hypothetical protein